MAAADRTVSVTLRMAAADYIANARKAKQATQDMGDAAAKTGPKLAEQAKAQQDAASAAKDASAEASAAAKEQASAVSDSGDAASAAQEQFANYAAVAGGVVAAGLATSVAKFAEFDKAMSAVAAGTGASAGELLRLKQAALDAGASTQYSATEAALAISELGKAGVDTADIYAGGLKGALSLAAAGQLDVADAAEIAASAMNQFGLEGKDVGHIADLLANGANAAQGSVDDMGQALNQAGIVANSFGIDIDDTTATLTLFAKSGLTGSDAGTSLKTMIQRLAAATPQAQKAMDELGLQIYDTSGQFVGMEAFAQQLQTQLGKLTDEQKNQALATIFGADAVRAAGIAASAGAEGFAKAREEVTKLGGAQEVAAKLTDNLAGDVERFGGALDTAFIQTGSAANDGIRSLVQNATGLVNAIGSLPGPLLLTYGALATTALVVPKLVMSFNALRASAAAAGITMAATRALLAGPLGLALAAGVVGLGLFTKGQLDAKASADELRGSLDQTTGAITDQTKQIVAQNLQTSGAFDIAKQYGVSLQDVTDAALGNSDALARIKTAQDSAKTATLGTVDASALLSQNLSGATPAFGDFGKQVASTSQVLDGQRTSFDVLFEAIGQNSSVLGPQIDQQKELADATGKTGGALDGLTEEQAKSAKAAQDQAEAAGEIAKAYDAARKAFIDYGNVLADSRDANRAYQSSLDQASASLQDQRKALADARLETLGIKDATQAQTDTALKFADAQIKAGAGLDISTEAGRNNQAALDDIATAAKNAALKNLENNVSVEKVTASMVGKGGAREAFINTAIAMGGQRKDAERLADQLGLTKQNVQNLNSELAATKPEYKTKVTAETATANAAVDGSRRKLEALDGKTANTRVTADTAGALANLQGLRNVLDSIRDKSVRVTTTMDTYTGLYNGKPVPKADGGVSREAMMSDRPILWAEAGPEAYIPLSPNKRQRSLALWRETGQILGAPDAAMRFADGGFVRRSMGQATASSVSATSAGPLLHVDTINTIDDRSAMRELNANLSAALIVNGLGV